MSRGLAARAPGPPRPPARVGAHHRGRQALALEPPAFRGELALHLIEQARVPGEVDQGHQEGAGLRDVDGRGERRLVHVVDWPDNVRGLVGGVHGHGGHRSFLVVWRGRSGVSPGPRRLQRHVPERRGGVCGSAAGTGRRLRPRPRCRWRHRERQRRRGRPAPHRPGRRARPRRAGATPGAWTTRAGPRRRRRPWCPRRCPGHRRRRHRAPSPGAARGSAVRPSGSRSSSGPLAPPARTTRSDRAAPAVPGRPRCAPLAGVRRPATRERGPATCRVAGRARSPRPPAC